jgi:peptide/nickel transport system substrate-binding protein
MTAMLLCVAACSSPDRRGDVVIYASGADLQSINPLLTLHPLARQVQRYALLTTLARYDSSLTPVPYLAREWNWSPDRKQLTMHLDGSVRWHDGLPTTARDAAWTLDAARDPVTGYPRQAELRELARVAAPDDTTLVLDWLLPQQQFPDVLTDLAILPSHLLDTIPHDRLRQASWNEHPVGNGPFRFVRHEPNRRWVFARNPDFPAALGGPPHIDRLVIAVVDEPMTKLAALVGGELDFAGIQPGHAPYVKKHADLDVIDYPLLFTYVVVLNIRRPPFDQLAVRRRLAAAIDRKEIVDGYAYGFATPAYAPYAPTAPSTSYPPHPPYPPYPPVSFELLTVGTGDNVLEQMLQSQLKTAGFTVTIRQLELSAFLDRIYGPTHDFTAAVMGVPGDLALGYLRPLGEVAGMTVPPDPKAATRLFLDSIPATFLYHARGVQGVNRRVLGVKMDTRGELVTLSQWHIAR